MQVQKKMRTQHALYQMIPCKTKLLELQYSCRYSCVCVYVCKKNQQKYVHMYVWWDTKKKSQKEKKRKKKKKT